MKKFTAIILLCTVLFHSGGFYLLFWVLRNQASREMTRRVDAASYGDGETITLKIPLAIPYNGDSNDYREISGEIESNGEYLRLVKQKFVRDTLYVIAVKDHRQKEISNAMSDFVKSSTDQPTSPAMKLLGSFVHEFVAVAVVEPIPPTNEVFDLTFDMRAGQILCAAVSVESPPPDQFL